MSTILVTGGAGYIGSHACKALAEAGYEPVTFDNLERGHEWAVQWGPLEQGNILDQGKLAEVMKKYRPDAVMHFAAYAYVGESVQEPEKYQHNNIDGSLVLLDVMRACDIDKIIFSSSCATYGIPENVPITEDHPQQPINPYGQTKREVEQLLDAYHEKHGLKSVSLRYFNAAGADPDGKTGEHHVPETHLVPLVLDTALGLYPHVQIFGDDYETRDGTCIRDYVHVMDVVYAHVLALQALEQNRSVSNAYNIGNEQGFSVREIISRAEAVTGKSIPVEISPRRPGDPAVLIGSSEKIRTELGWQPGYSEIDQILETAWQWHRKQWKSVKREA